VDASGVAASTGELEAMVSERARAIYLLGRRGGNGVVLVSVTASTNRGTTFDGDSDADVSGRGSVVVQVMRAIYRAMRTSGGAPAGGVGLSAGARRGGRSPAEWVTRIRVDVRQLGAGRASA
jgi:hypothetical protein